MQRRILFTASSYSHICNFHRPYLREFSRLGWRVDVACGGSPMRIPEAHQVIHTPFEKKLTAPANWKAVRLLRRKITENRYDLISCHTSLASFFTRVAVAGLPARPLVACTSHGYLFDEASPAFKRLLFSSAEKAAAPVTDLLMTMNQWDTDYAAEHKLGRQIRKIPGMGVDLQRLSCDKDSGADLRRSLGLGEEHFVLVYAAEYSPRKSHSYLLKALCKAPAQVVLALPGRGEQLEYCMGLAEELGLQHRVIFPGQVSDMAPWYAAADAAVSSSRSEGLPFNVMEAMGASLPVVASQVKGHTDLIRHEENGLLFPYGDEQACADQIRRLAEEPDLARRLGMCAYDTVQKYSLSSVLPQVMSVYEELLQVPIMA